MKKLYDKDVTWRKMARSMGCPESIVGDVVNDMYLKVHTIKNPERIFDDVTGEPSTTYIYLCLRSCMADHYNALKKYKFVNKAEVFEHEEGYEEAWEKLYMKVNDHISSMGIHASLVCEMYFKTGKSLRTVAKESGISVTSLFHNQKNYRKIIQELFKEDYEDLKNGDYGKIK